MNQRSHRISPTRTAWVGTAVVLTAPTVLLAGFVYHPYVAIPIDEAALAAATASDTTRWGLAHLVIGVGYGLTALAFLAVRRHLREAGEERWSASAVPFVVIGCSLFAILTGMEFAPLAAAETGGDVEAAQSELAPWFIPIGVLGALSFTLGALGFAQAIRRSAVLPVRATRLVVGALIVMAAARFVPLGVAQPVIGVAGVLALWPLAVEMRKHPEAKPTPQPESLSTS